MTEVISAVVITHNRLTQLRHTLDRVLAEGMDHVVVVNNASSDGTDAYLSTLDDPRVCILNLPENVGGAGGFEAGLKEVARRFDPDWVVIMDDDAYPRPGAIDVFRSGDKNSAAIIAASVSLPGGDIAEMNRPWTNPFRTLAAFLRTVSKGRAGFHIEDSAYRIDRSTRVDGASFVGLFLSRKVLERVGFPNGRLFIYGDDVLYTLKASKSGSKILFDPKIEFEHNCETGSTVGIFTPLWKNYYRFRNQIFVYRLAAGPLLGVFVILAQVSRWFLWSLKLPSSERRVYLRVLRTALLDAMRRNLDRRHEDVLTFSEVNPGTRAG